MRKQTSEFSDTPRRVNKIVQSIFHDVICLLYRYRSLIDFEIFEKKNCWSINPFNCYYCYELFASFCLEWSVFLNLSNARSLMMLTG